MDKIKHKIQERWKQFTLRFFAFFTVLSVIPFDRHFYNLLFAKSPWLFNAYEWVTLFSYYPKFLLDGTEFGLYSFVDLAIVVAVSLVGATVWGKARKPKVNYSQLHYWLRVAMRYRLAIALIGYGLLKIFVLQIPYPSLSNLHTNYGDFLPWKIYYHTIGVVQGYEQFLGVVEVAAGILILIPRTVTLGTGIVLGFIGNVFMVNFAYQIGDHIFTIYLLIFAAFLFAYDIPRLYDLLYLQKKATASRFVPEYTSKLKKAKVGLLAIYFSLVFIVLIKSLYGYNINPIYSHQEEVLKNSYGFYNVKDFIFNGDTIPYSIDDPVRWQNVVFEKWASLSIKIAKPVELDLNLAKEISFNMINYESAGVGDRHYFIYKIDSLNQKLLISNKGTESTNSSFELAYSRPDDKSIVLNGVDQDGNQLSVVLEKIEKKYLLYEGRRKPVKL